MKNKYRVYGISKISGTRKYLSWRSYKSSIFFNTLSNPTDFRTVVPDDFISVQLEAQKYLKDVKWEVESVHRESKVVRPLNMAAVSDCWDQVKLTKSN